MTVRNVRNVLKRPVNLPCEPSETSGVLFRAPDIGRGRSDAQNSSEASEQMKVVEWCRQQAYLAGTPGEGIGAIFHIPNGEYRTKSAAGRLKAMGVRAGVPDLFLPVPVIRPSGAFGVALMDAGGRLIARVISGLWIEMKCSTGSLSKEQSKWIDLMLRHGYMAVTCYSADEAINVIKEYMSEY